MASIRDSLFGTLAVRAGFATKEELKECLTIQESYRAAGGRVPRLGELLAQKGYMTAEQVRSVLKGQHAAERALFGETAVRLAFTTRERMHECLDAQRSGRKGKLGQILAGKGYLTPAQVHSVLEAQGKHLVRCPGCGKGINAAGLVPGRQITCPNCRRASSAAEAKPAPRGQLAAEYEVQAREPAAEKKLEIGGYEILTKLGSDGTGTYCKARHLQTDSVCALKIMSPHAMSDKAFVKRFIEEGKKGTAVQHKNIKRLYEVGVDKGRYYFSTEFVEGASLRRVLEGGKKLPPQQAIDIAIKVGEALEYAHSRGVLHGDVRPSNIIIANDGTVKLAALGLAKDVGANLRHFARSKEVTAFYLAPEQAVDDTRVDERTDVYSLGATVYHMATGSPPYQGDSPLEILMRMSEEELAPPDGIEPRVPVQLSRVIMKMLGDEPGKRHQSAAECLSELRNVRELVASGKATYPTGKRPPVTPSRRARTVKIPKTRRGLATVGAGDKEAVGTSPRITGFQRPAAGGGKKVLLIVGVIVVAGVALVALWQLTGPGASFGEQAREVRRQKERKLQEKQVEIDEAAKRGEVISEEYRLVMQFARENKDSPEAIDRLEKFVKRYPDSLHSSSVKEEIDRVKARRAALQLASISKRAADATGGFTDLLAEIDSWLELNPSHRAAEVARSLRVRLGEKEIEVFDSAMRKAEALSKEGDWEGALAELDRAAREFRGRLAVRAREKRRELEALRDKAAGEEEARLAAEQAGAEKRRKAADALRAFTGASRSALGALRAFDFGRAREALMEARASVRGTAREKDVEDLLAGVELAKRALGSLPGRFGPGVRLEVTGAGVRTQVSGVDENGVIITMEKRGKKLDFPILWKRLSPEDLYAALSALADWKDADYLVGAALLCTASEKPSYAGAFLASAAKKRDVSLYRKLIEQSSAPPPEEAAPAPEPEAALAPPGEAPTAPAAAGEVTLDLSELEERGGDWELQGGKLRGKDGSVSMATAGLESVSGTLSFSALDGSAEVTAGQWTLQFWLAQKRITCTAGPGKSTSQGFPVVRNTPYSWSMSLDGGEAVFTVGAKELARFPSAEQGGTLWFTLTTNSYVTISSVKLKQTGKKPPKVRPAAPAAPAAGGPTPALPTATGMALAGWKVVTGNWNMDDEGALTGSVKDGTASISHSIQRPFVIQAELEGRAQQAGISFGRGKDFFVIQAGVNQMIRLEVDGSVRFLVDGKQTRSVGNSVAAKRPASVGNEFTLVVNTGRVRFKVSIEEGG